MGWATATGLISNCLMLGEMNISSSGGDVICRNPNNAILLNTYYYTDWAASRPADAISTDWYEMASGKLCYLLNDGRTEEKQAWFQTLEEDSYPLPDDRHMPVWLYEGDYYNESPDAILAPMANGKWADGQIYDLSGRRINGLPRHGIYIVNRKKMLR